MAKRRDYSKSTAASQGDPEAGALPADQPAVPGVSSVAVRFEPHRGPHYTGRSVVIYRDATATDAGLRRIASVTGLKMVADTQDYAGGAIDLGEASAADGVHFHRLGVTIYEGDPDQLRRLPSLAGADSQILAVVPERFMFLAVDPPRPPAADPRGSAPSLDYLRGLHQGLGMALSGMAPGATWAGPSSELIMPADVTTATYADTLKATWGLQAVNDLRGDGTPISQWTGKGARVAVIDTGIDLNHPAFQGRIAGQFPAVAGETSVQDSNGHGTHVAGTIGGVRPIGVAPEVSLYIAKVFPGGSETTDQRAILAAINWAIDQKCQVASMSLSGPVTPGQAPNADYEQIGKRALDAGTLLVAAAGNASDRANGSIMPVGEPANSSTIVAVGAIDPSLQMANFSNGGINAQDGGAIDFVGPGINVFSAWPMPVGTHYLSGTSQATPHISGLAALLSQSRGGVGGVTLWQLLAATAKALPLAASDIGNGLGQAP